MAKYAARGITVAIDGTPAVQLTQWDQVGSSRDLIDASAFGDDWKDYVTGQQDGDEINFAFAYDPAETSHGDFLDAFNSAGGGTTNVFTLEHADSGFDVDVTCIITALRRGGALGDLLQMSGTAKIVNPGVEDNS